MLLIVYKHVWIEYGVEWDGLALSPAQAWIMIHVKHYKMKRNNETIQTVNMKYTYKGKVHKLPWKGENRILATLITPWTDVLQMI